MERTRRSSSFLSARVQFLRCHSPEQCVHPHDFPFGAGHNLETPRQSFLHVRRQAVLLQQCLQPPVRPRQRGVAGRVEPGEVHRTSVRLAHTAASARALPCRHRARGYRCPPWRSRARLCRPGQGGLTGANGPRDHGGPLSRGNRAGFRGRAGFGRFMPAFAPGRRRTLLSACRLHPPARQRNPDSTGRRSRSHRRCRPWRPLPCSHRPSVLVPHTVANQT